MTQEAAKTGLGPTALVAIEQHYPPAKRIHHDPVAFRFLPLRLKAFVTLLRPRWLRGLVVRSTEKQAPGLWAGMMCRKRAIDEKLLQSLDDTHAVVNLGAGFDTRVYRIPDLYTRPNWEVDQFENVRAKQTLLRKLYGQIPAHVTLVSVDLDRQDLSGVLRWQGCPTEKPAFYIMEALTQYLSPQGVATAFDFLGRAAPGSRLAFTYVLQAFLQGQDMHDWWQTYREYVVPGIWKFGMPSHAWPGFLEKHGWQLLEDVSYEELAEKYLPPTGRTLASTPVERLVFAQKT